MTQFAILKINRGWDGYCVCDVSSVIIRDHPHNNNNKKNNMSNTGFKKDFKIWANKKIWGLLSPYYFSIVYSHWESKLITQIQMSKTFWFNFIIHDYILSVFIEITLKANRIKKNIFDTDPDIEKYIQRIYIDFQMDFRRRIIFGNLS